MIKLNIKKYLIVYVVLSAIFGAVITFFIFNQKIKNNPKIFIEKVAKNYPKNFDNSSAQWFMKKNLIGKWEKLMFIFGYADDKSVCNFMLKIAEETDPETKFRCKDVN